MRKESLEKERAEIWVGRGPAGANFFRLYLKGEEINNTIAFAGIYKDCTDVGKGYAKKMLEERCFEYVIINGEIPPSYPLPVPQGGIDVLVTAIGEKFKLIKNE